MRAFFLLCAAFVASHCLPAGATYLELTASTLVSRPAIKFTLEQRESGGREVVTLMHAPGGAESTPVAVIEISGSSARTQIIVRLKSPVSTDPEVELSALERLYTVALQLDPEAGFCFSNGRKTCGTSTARESHADLLRQIAAAREGVLARTRLAGTPWRMVDVSSPPSDTRAPQRVSARFTLAGTPLRDTRIFFSRAPHSACVAKTGTDGVASCELVDQHADEDQHGDDRAAIATFPGDVTAERILPPITTIVSAGRP